MNVTTIVMDKKEAQAKIEAFGAALAKRHSAAVEQEWNAALNAYRELASGTPLVDPFAAIREAGWRLDSRPKLAIARADRKQVSWRANDERWWSADQKAWIGQWTPMTWTFDASMSNGALSRRYPLILRVDKITVNPPGGTVANFRLKFGTAMVPMVPPDVLPGRGCDLSKHFIMWEVESWDAAPPRDPILLKPIGGNLYAVIAQWDLTDIERAIIAGTRK